MVSRSLLLRHLKNHHTQRPVSLSLTRCLATKSTSKPARPAPTKVQPEQPKSWLTRKVETSPTAKRIFFGFTNLLGYGSDKQVAGRRAQGFYEQLCAVMPDQQLEFWQKECFLPPTFQSWFTVTNLHLWMLTVRLRALPPAYGKAYQQALVDHFFIDIEDRIRAVLQPPTEPKSPYTFISKFYPNPNASLENTQTQKDGKPKPRGSAPDRIVTRQMKIFKEQYTGMGLSLDLGLVKGDQELAAAVWRNLLGARGAQGIAYPNPSSPSATSPSFRRAVNLVGGEVVNVAKLDLEKEETTDDGSGVHDFPPSESDNYLTYPEVMLNTVGYVRRELKRLERISDEDIVSGDWTKLKFGRVKSN